MSFFPCSCEKGIRLPTYYDFETITDQEAYPINTVYGPLGNVFISDIFLDGVRITSDRYLYDPNTSVLTITGNTSGGVPVHINFKRL